LSRCCKYLSPSPSPKGKGNLRNRKKNYHGLGI
jgi:hypothetical protein